VENNEIFENHLKNRFFEEKRNENDINLSFVFGKSNNCHAIKENIFGIRYLFWELNTQHLVPDTVLDNEMRMPIQKVAICVTFHNICCNTHNT
jgi:hypothetical protein